MLLLNYGPLQSRCFIPAAGSISSTNGALETTAVNAAHLYNVSVTLLKQFSLKQFFVNQFNIALKRT